MEPNKYPYSTSLKWTGEHKGILECDGKPDIQVACPPEWGGHPDIWSPEDLFVGAVEVCTMTTFLWLAEQEDIALKSYQSKAKAVAQMRDGNFGFDSVVVKLKIGLASEGDRPKIDRIIREIGKWCLVTKSIKPEVVIEPEVFVE